jgi:hypothetical protein
MATVPECQNQTYQWSWYITLQISDATNIILCHRWRFGERERMGLLIFEMLTRE